MLPSVVRVKNTIAVFGAGTGLGTAVARRFGREGYRVALVARRPEPIEALARELTEAGIDARAYPADLSRTASVPALLDAIGPVDVVEYAPVGAETFTPALDLTPEALQRYLDLFVLTPLAIVRAVAPAMVARRAGGILVAHGSTARTPIPGMSGVGPAMAASRNYLGALHGELAGHGVYVGSLVIGALIRDSAGHRAITSGEVPVPDGVDLVTVAPEDLADAYWDMFTKRDEFERIIP